MRDDAARALIGLGFTDLEAEVYAFLVQESPATGYRIAQAISKPTANTYKTIQSLERKGAVVSDDGDTRLCRAVPPEELVGRLGRVFQQRCDEAAQALASLGTPPDDDRVYQMSSRGQVLERCRQMLRRSQQLALVVAFPEPLTELRQDLETAAGRGVDVVVKAYSPIEVAGAEVVMSAVPDRMLGPWPGQELRLVVDAREFLVGMLHNSGEGVLQTIWSRSPILSLNYHNGIACEIAFTDLARRLISDASSPPALVAAVNAVRRPADTLGFRELVRRLRPEPRESADDAPRRGKG